MTDAPDIKQSIRYTDGMQAIALPHPPQMIFEKPSAFCCSPLTATIKQRSVQSRTGWVSGGGTLLQSFHSKSDAKQYAVLNRMGVQEESA